MSEYLKMKGLCPKCAEEIEVTASEDAMVCPHCNSPISCKKAIGEYLALQGMNFAKKAKNKGMEAGKSASKYISKIANQVEEKSKKNDISYKLELKPVLEEDTTEKDAYSKPENCTSEYSYTIDEEYIEKPKKKKKMSKKSMVILIVAILILSIISIISGGTVEDTKIKMPFSSSNVRGMNYLEVEKSLTEAGFTNVKLNPEYDIIIGLIYKEGEVGEVSVDGYTSYSTDSKFEKDCEIIINYHLLSSDNPENKKDDNVVVNPGKQDNPSEGYPVIPNVSVDKLKTVLKNYSDFKKTADNDFMEKTKIIDLESSDLSVSSIYLPSTGEVCDLEIYALNKSANDKIVGIIKELFDASDNSSVGSWVENNINAPAVTKIDGISYEIIISTTNANCAIIKVNEEKLNAWMTANSSTENEIEGNSGITEAQALTITRKYAESICVYGIDLNMLSGMSYIEKNKEDGSFDLHIIGKYKNAYGTKCDCTVISTISAYGEILYFKIKDGHQ